MTTPPAPISTPLIGIAAVMSFMPFGVSLVTLVLGGVCFFGGCCARTGLSLYKKLDGPGDVSFRDFLRAVAALLCCIPLSAVASCVVFLAAHVLKIEADAAFGGLLLVMGVRGPEGFQWLMDMFTNTFSRVVPGDRPTGGGP